MTTKKQLEKCITKKAFEKCKCPECKSYRRDKINALQNIAQIEILKTISGISSKNAKTKSRTLHKRRNR